jgi:hypothetical protein
LTSIAILVPFDKIRDRSGEIAHLQIAATAQFASDILRTSSDQCSADRVAILAGQQVLNYRFEVGGFVIGFAPSSAYRPKSSATK